MKADPRLYFYRIAVRRVIDGDTIEAGIDLGLNVSAVETIRLYNVDTPETRGAKASPAGAEAKLFTDRWLRGGFAGAPYLEGLTLDSREFDAREKYGRVLGVIYRAGDPVALNDALRAAGLTNA